MNREFDPRPPLRVLRGHDVRFVIIGGIAGVLLGSPSLTFDLDICYARDRTNLEALAAALVELQATLRGAPSSAPFLLDAKTLQMGDSFTFDTINGSLDCLGTPAGTSGYADLARNAPRPKVLSRGQRCECGIPFFRARELTVGQTPEQVSGARLEECHGGSIEGTAVPGRVRRNRPALCVNALHDRTED